MTSPDGSGGLAKYIEGPDAFVISEVESGPIAYARKKGINIIFLYGDLGDAPRMSYEGMMALSGLFSRNLDMMFYVILGNHDMYGKVPSTGHSLELLQALYDKPNLRIFTKPKTIEIDGVRVRFLPYPHESFDVRALNVYHKEVRGSKGDSGRVMDSKDLPVSKAVTVAGHLHTAHRVRNTYYSGTLYQTNFGESGPKYFHHIEFRSPKDYVIELVPHVAKYQLHNVVIQTRADLVNIPRGETNLVKLVVQDGADISAIDLNKFPNIAITKPFKTKEDLQTVLTEDLVEGQELIIRTSDFFREWLASQSIDSEMRKRVKATRLRVLSSAGER